MVGYQLGVCNRDWISCSRRSHAMRLSRESTGVNSECGLLGGSACECS